MGKLQAANHSNAIVENCWIVPDIHAGMKKWLALGYGPFLLIEKVDIPDADYRGSKVPMNVSIALAHGGDVVIELIQQHSSGPSAFRDAYGPDEGGFHHVCWICADYAAERAAMIARGYAIASEASIFGVQFCYADTRADFGCMIEMVPDTPVIRNLYQAVAEVANGWDGRDPIRTLKL